MNRQPPAVHIVRFFAEQIEQLGVAHGDQEVKAIVGVTHNEEQRGTPVSQGVQLQLVIGSDLPQLRNIEHGEARTAGNQDKSNILLCLKSKGFEFLSAIHLSLMKHLL